MGVINCTPDSFHEESRTESLEHSMKVIEKMILDGADWIDVGGESTRPGANEITIEEEIQRVIPIIEQINKKYPYQAISIHTRRSAVAKKALDAGAVITNDVSGSRHPRIKDLVMNSGCGICIMHMKGEPGTMQNSPMYENVVDEVNEILLKNARELVEKGHPLDRICLDPGIGFGKTLEHNLDLLRNSHSLKSKENFSILWGVSRKSMFKDLLGRLETNNRLAGTLGVAAFAQISGIDILRVHDVAEHVDVGKTLSKLGGF